MNRARAVFTSLLLVPLASSAQVPWVPLKPDNAAVLRFAKTNAGKYAQELGEKGPRVGTPMSVRFRLPGYELVGWTYDPAQATLILRESFTEFSEFEFSKLCRPSGSFKGQNSYGARATVKRERCELGVLELASFRGIKFLPGVETTLSPAEYRVLKTAGVDAEVDFVLASRQDSIVADETETTESATLQAPIETSTRRLTVYGQIRQIRLLFPRGPIVVYGS